jgi:ribosome-associated protein
MRVFCWVPSLTDESLSRKMCQMLYVNDQISIPDAEFTFTYSRSGGPGGQNVNKVSSRATMHWNVTASTSLPAAVKQRFLSRYSSRITTDGSIVIHSQRFRDQSRNTADCLSKLQELIQAVEKPPVPRKRTRPTRGSNQRRLKNKKQTAERKQRRKPPGLSD